MGNVSRRRLLGLLTAGAIVAGFDPSTRSWVSLARADWTPGCQSLPPLAGVLAFDMTTRTQHAEDFGHIVHRVPSAVLLPGSVADVVAMVRFCRAHGIRIASRGRGHTPLGHSQVEAGLSVDLTTLDAIHDLTGESVTVDAGVLWTDLLAETLAVGRTPPVLTDYTGLTVGGTLSVGGVSGASYLHGAQVDNVLALQVVTGAGDLVTCSPDVRPRVFHAALAGLGLVGIIVRARLRLIPARPMARTHRFFYADLPTMLHDMRLLAETPRFDHLRGSAEPTPGGWQYSLDATSFYTPGDAPGEVPPDGASLGLPLDPSAALQAIPGATVIEDQSYADFCDAVRRLVELLDLLGLGGLPHPWLDLFVPDSRIDALATGALANIDPASQIPGSIALFYVFRRSLLGEPMLRAPSTDTFFLFDLLLTAPPVPSVVNAFLARNRALYESNRSHGGTQYTNSAVPMSAADWRAHYLPGVWGQLAWAKHTLDPDNVLGGGLSVF